MCMIYKLKRKVACFLWVLFFFFRSSSTFCLDKELYLNFAIYWRIYKERQSSISIFFFSQSKCYLSNISHHFCALREANLSVLRLLGFEHCVHSESKWLLRKLINQFVHVYGKTHLTWHSGDALLRLYGRFQSPGSNIHTTEENEAVCLLVSMVKWLY